MDKANINYGLYLVTDREITGQRDFLDTVERAILGGVTVVQLREKDVSSLEFLELAKALKSVTQKHSVPLIINDRLDIALCVDAEGLHVGQGDIPLSYARKILGADKIIGVSTATLQEAIDAQKSGADYIGVGAMFPTSTKSDTRKVTLEQLKEIKESVSIPVVAIGGINASNAAMVYDTGADGIAVVSAILGQDDVILAAQDLLNKKY
jgi:thiamine-phosphate pyrophosphorylase